MNCIMDKIIERKELSNQKIDTFYNKLDNIVKRQWIM